MIFVILFMVLILIMAAQQKHKLKNGVTKSFVIVLLGLVMDQIIIKTCLCGCSVPVRNDI